MSVAEMLLHMLIRFPKVTHRHSLHLLRLLFLPWNASAQKGKRKYSSEDNTGNISPSTLHEEKGGGAGTHVVSAAALCSEDEGSALSRRLTPRGTETPAPLLSAEGRGSTLSIPQPSSTNLLEPTRTKYPPTQAIDQSHLHVCAPPLKNLNELFTRTSLYSLVCMLLFLDHPGFTDINKWKAFWEMFQKDVENINLLATVLLSGNVSFLATISNNGLSYWPQRLSYVSLVAALGSILMGLAVRTPRFFTAYTSFYFQCMVLVLGFPFELFLYSIILFIAVFVVHFSINAAMLQIYATIVIMGLVIPLEGRKVPKEGIAVEVSRNLFNGRIFDRYFKVTLFLTE
ncbi:hypothetical protein F5J12DRAFT_849975 [Pisolithus orientalis]|uniref:uncharacterized protein n=1 Tax=Pisolithus orientalis TaxID=936130 RepID=UPI002224EE6C|nr:uncharacterized protein F5J12DRAFT_849975 [Pisolithus orientalis]KAI5998371.1 hypothetical protein F5J12DRAFT_849975 [Pisolithus orientalis]